MSSKLSVAITYRCQHCGKPVTVGHAAAWPSQCPHCKTAPTLVIGSLLGESREESEVSTLNEILRAYLRSNGFHPTASDGSDEYGWGHPELGEGRTFMQCVEWQIGREQASADETAVAAIERTA